MESSFQVKTSSKWSAYPQPIIEIFIKTKEDESSEFQIVQQQFSWKLKLGSRRSCRIKLEVKLKSTSTKK